MSELLTTIDAAAYLRVSPRTMIRWRVQRTGPAWTYAGTQVRYRRADLDEYLDRRRRTPVRDAAEAT